MKYIIYEGFSNKEAVIFPNNIEHFAMWMKMKNFQQTEDDVVSAGFISHTHEGIVAWGESVSLRVKSLPSDTEFIRRQMSR
jgi:hypothetical protein